MRLGFVLFDGVTPLHLTGPFQQLFSPAPGYDGRLIAASDKPTTTAAPSCAMRDAVARVRLKPGTHALGGVARKP